MSLSFTCPRCRALLKVRDDSFVGTALNCPDCQAPLLVALSASGEIIGQEVPPEKPAPGTTAPKRAATSRPQTRPSQKSSEEPSFEALPVAAAGSRTPQIVAWVVAGICLLALIPFLIPAGKSDPVVPEKAEKPGPEIVDQAPAPPAVANVTPEAEQPQPQPLPDTGDERLEALGKLVLEAAKAEGHFPAGTVMSPGLNVTQRWSWLAQLAAQHDNPRAVPVDWQQRWNDPSQDRFVRRPIPRFQNPQIATIVSEDRYPATHFVGVAGVGPDAPTLPVDHSRAGIFGQDRQTKLDQIRDGASNTMLIAGVEERLASWAEGAASYRAFTREPYLHGPDGFGTGQPDRMLVLMADGSVREVNKQTDPRLIRRMAAMNDGFPLDAEIPGEPGDPRPGTVPMPDPLTAKVNSPEKVAVIPEPVKPVETPVKPIDIPAALSRKILKFEQTKPAAAFQLLLQIEELAGVRIEYDRKELGDAAERLDKQITLNRENASLEDLLDDVLKQINLQRKSEATCIRIVTSENT